MTEFGFDKNLLNGNPYHSDINFTWLSLKEKNFQALLFDDLKDITLRISLQSFDRAIKNINKRSKLVCKKTYYVEDDSHEHLATDEQKVIIDNELTKIKNANHSRKYDLLFVEYYNKKIYNELNKVLEKQFHFITKSTVWDISLSNASEYDITQLYNQIFDSMDSNQINEFLFEQKTQINSRIIQQVKRQLQMIISGYSKYTDSDYIREKRESINYYMDTNYPIKSTSQENTYTEPMQLYTWEEQDDILHQFYYKLLDEYLAL